MNLKSRYIWKYFCFRAIPIILVILFLAGILFYIAHSIEKQSESVGLIVLGISMCAGTFGYYIGNICRFSFLIDDQKKRYCIDFHDNDAITITLVSQWIILSRAWLILPGRLALYRKHIERASITEITGKGGIRYQVRLKTKTGKSFRIRFYKQESAKRIQKWVNQ